MTNSKVRATNQKVLKQERDKAIADLKRSRAMIKETNETVSNARELIGRLKTRQAELTNTVTVQAKQIKNIQALPWYKRLPFVWDKYNQGFEE